MTLVLRKCCASRLHLGPIDQWKRAMVSRCIPSTNSGSCRKMDDILWNDKISEKLSLHVGEDGNGIQLRFVSPTTYLIQTPEHLYASLSHWLDLSSPPSSFYGIIVGFPCNTTSRVSVQCFLRFDSIFFLSIRNNMHQCIDA